MITKRGVGIDIVYWSLDMHSTNVRCMKRVITIICYTPKPAYMNDSSIAVH